MSHEVSIPVADLTLFRSGRPADSARFLETWDYAFRTFGFVFLANHGLEDLYQALHNESKRFFELPLEEKLKFRIAQSYGHGGYIPQGQENVSRTFLQSEDHPRPPDAVESLASSKSKLSTFPNKQNGYPDNELSDKAHELVSALNLLTIEVMAIMATCLELPPTFFSSFYGAGRANNDLRIARYLRTHGRHKAHRGTQLRYGEHTDYTGFTFLWRSADNGLQCLDTRARNVKSDEPLQDRWLDIPVLKKHQNALIVNAGDLIQRWTNNYWISNIHRVLAQPGSGDDEVEAKPISAVYFTGPHRETPIKVLSQSPKVASMGPTDKAYAEAITAGEHLWEKVNASNG